VLNGTIRLTRDSLKLRALDIAVIGIWPALYAVVGRLTDFGVTFIEVAFWPAAVIPAIFAVLYGPWVGGAGRNRLCARALKVIIG